MSETIGFPRICCSSSTKVAQTYKDIRIFREHFRRWWSPDARISYCFWPDDHQELRIANVILAWGWWYFPKKALPYGVPTWWFHVCWGTGRKQVTVVPLPKMLSRCPRVLPQSFPQSFVPEFCPRALPQGLENRTKLFGLDAGIICFSLTGILAIGSMVSSTVRQWSLSSSS